MFSLKTLALTTLLTSLATAQYSIDPNSVSNATRQSWCNSQTNECPLICTQYPGNSAATDANTCNPDTLAYACVCSNGIAPNASEYSQTLPYFVCTEWGNQCVTNCGNDNTCASDCRSEHPCGAQHPTLQNTSTLSSTMSSTATASGGSGATTGASGTVYTGFAGAASTASSTATGSTSAAAMARFEVGQAYGLFVVAAGMFGGFALLL